jgi:hypothetical protein
VAFSTTQVEALLHEGWIGAPGTRLRDEDRKKVVELGPLLGELGPALGKRVRVLVDAAAGKGYVGLLAAKLLLAPGSRVVLIERNPAHVRCLREAAERVGRTDVAVEIREADVADPAAWPERPDVVVALHACGPASDAVIAGAIAAEARRLFLVPCCTGQSPTALVEAERLAIPRQAPVRRAFVEAMVAAERTRRLEAAGYEVVVAPLVPPSVTPYNLVWRARAMRPVR